MVRGLLALDRAGMLRFAPLGGETFRDLVPEAERAALPDSLVLRTADGRLLVRSTALRESLRLVGGPSRALAALVGVVPTSVADRLYDSVARLRSRLFTPPLDACPSVRRGSRERVLP